ncbi:MAG: hypothetical protein CSB21_00580 [Deltaproteobacteria bacterium]|nr:MAG: hypothetical protein CSB21_00580 [Deltaproteobacteria bacterium]
MKKYPHILAVFFSVFFVILSINPVDRTVWAAEVIPVIGVFVALVFTFNKFRFSNTAYTLMAIWLFWHTIGGHYTFANVPFGFVSDLFGFERNHFDRVGHFAIGFYAFAMAEFLFKKKYASRNFSMVSGLFFIMSVACAYEIIEWIYAVYDGGNAGLEFLGSQGDIWDAQKDMLADTLGAITSLVVFYFYSRFDSDFSL